jgi:plastocyanin
MVLASCSGSIQKDGEVGSNSGVEEKSATNCPPPTPEGDSPGCEPPFDSLGPSFVPGSASGAVGFSRYVFANLNGTIATVLVEGPSRDQVRCQEPELPCSYLDLKSLHESGDVPPAELQMTREELADLVSQLDTVSAATMRFADINDACAAGYGHPTVQVPNMGVHLMRDPGSRTQEVRLDDPPMLLYGREDGYDLSAEQLGDCVDGKWAGVPKLRVVGASYLHPADNEEGRRHPEVFAGPLDNWHRHFKTCGTRNPFGGFVSRAECEARGDPWLEASSWMIHVYAVPDFDSQTGVFAMWNSSIWPVTSPGAVTAENPPDGQQDGQVSLIQGFAFSPVVLSVGERVIFRNMDDIDHTVTSGKPDATADSFAEGVIAPGGSFTIDLDRPGEFHYYCRYHQFMVGRMVVR